MRTTTLGIRGPEIGVIGLGCMGMTFAYDMAASRDRQPDRCQPRPGRPRLARLLGSLPAPVGSRY
jgi:hypothetical protein